MRGHRNASLYGLIRESNARRQYELGRKRLTLGPQAAEIHNGYNPYVIAAAATPGVLIITVLGLMLTRPGNNSDNKKEGDVE